jgi:hypothetical protein
VIAAGHALFAEGADGCRDQAGRKKLEANGKALDFNELLRMEPDSGTTKNPQREQRTGSAGWPLRTAAWCLTSFSEYDTMNGKKAPVWFAPDESRPLPRFAPTGHASRKPRKARSCHLFGFLTCEPRRAGGFTGKRCR